MTPAVIPINLAFEDALTEIVALKVLPAHYATATVYNRGGYGYLRTHIGAFNNAAKGTPYLVVTDLDVVECPATLISEWLGRASKHPNLIFRIAVREAEAWLLAHREALADFFGIRIDLLPANPETLDDPKAVLVDLARRSPRKEIRTEIPPRANSTSKVGPNYNGRLSQFVQSHWDPAQASGSSESLRRMIERLNAFTPTWAAHPEEENQQ